MKDPNSHVREFLEYYSSFEGKPGYALLLKGKWGSGKTWFVNKHLSMSQSTKFKYLYVSLYGISSFDEIDNELFRKLHPFLSSKPVLLARQITTSFAKLALKFDIDGDGVRDGNVSLSIPNLELEKNFSDPSKYILVFDDLERTSLDIEKVLGYINYFVEHQGCKVVIVSNETKINSKDESDEKEKRYFKIKEKLVGKTFEIHSDLPGALAYFIRDIKDEEARSFFRKKVSLIEEYYRLSQHENLRSLRQALLEFERIFSCIDKSIRKNEAVIVDFFSTFLALFFETRSNSISLDSIALIKSELTMKFRGADRTNTEEELQKNIFEKYPEFKDGVFSLSTELWSEIFKTGKICAESINKELRQSRYFSNEHTPDWLKILDIHTLGDDEFKQQHDSILDNFSRRKYEQYQVIQHVTGIFLWMSNHGLSSKTGSKILEDSKAYIDYLTQSFPNQFYPSEVDDFGEDESWGKHTFFNKDSPEFKALSRYIKSKKEELLEKFESQKAQELLDYLHQQDSSAFIRRTRWNTYVESNFVRQPVLRRIEPSDFLAALMALVPLDRNRVVSALINRYEAVSGYPCLLSELNWLRALVKCMESKQTELKGRLSSFQIWIYKKELMQAISKLVSYQTELNK